VLALALPLGIDFPLHLRAFFPTGKKPWEKTFASQRKPFF